MKKSIRRGVFETNSSSTHSITICTKEEYDKWFDGLLVLDTWESKLKLKEDCKYQDYAETYKKFCEDEYLETFEKSYTTPSGDTIVAFGKYGYI